MDLSEMLKPEISRGNIQMIGATTSKEYREKIEKDSGFARRFENIVIQEPNVNGTLAILRGIEQSFEQHHGVIILDSALKAAVELSNKYIKDSHQPDKAIGIIDQAAVRVSIEMH